MNILNILNSNLKNINLNHNSFLKELENTLKNTPSTNYIIDRIEGAYAVCENCTTLEFENILLSKLPNKIKSGSIISSQNGKFRINNILQEERKTIINKKSNQAFK